MYCAAFATEFIVGQIIGKHQTIIMFSIFFNRNEINGTGRILLIAETIKVNSISGGKIWGVEEIFHFFRIQ